MREGLWPKNIVSPITAPERFSTFSSSVGSSVCEVFTFELNKAASMIKVDVEARLSFAIALYEGKAVAVGGPEAGMTSYKLNSIAIDTVIVYSMLTKLLDFCIRFHNENEDLEWEREPYIVNNLQLPIKELMPLLFNPDAEFDEGKKRLLPYESLDFEEFNKLANILRIGLQRVDPPRPIDQVLLMRDNLEADFEELVSLDPIRVLLSHPKWRRVLGFGWFDNDPSLVVGDTYEYRITGFFPQQDLNDLVYGFHMIPSQTALPAEFYLHDLRIRLPQPTTVTLSPDTAYSDLLEISRRGIKLYPQNQSYWLVPSLENWSLVIDFPSPVRSVILELYENHDLEFVASTISGSPSLPMRLPEGARPRIDFLYPVQQLRLRGKGFLFAIRIPTPTVGLNPLSVVLPPVKLADTIRPRPPTMASITNLQQSQPVAFDDKPSTILSPQNALGFKIQWRPDLVNGLSIWPSDIECAPPLDATIYQIEHRELSIVSGFPMDIISTFNGLGPIGYHSIVDNSGNLGINPELLKTIRKLPLKKKTKGMLATGIAIGDVKAVQEILFTPTTDWVPLLPDENYTFGDRDETTRNTAVFPGVDLMALFPDIRQRPPGAGLDVFWRDVFDFTEGGSTIRRDVPSPGTYHQYRIATIDPIGRSSLSYCETNILRLEKHLPPPVPVGPNETPADSLSLPTPTGVHARILVQNAHDLTEDDLLTLASDNNVIILNWGWHYKQRKQDSFAREFRIYIADKPLDSVRGNLTNVVTLSPGIYNVTLDLEREVVADAAKGSNLNAGYPFYIRTHTAGSTITAIVEANVPGLNNMLPEPIIGSVQLPLHMTPNLTRPPAWSKRLEIQPITSKTKYQSIIRNSLSLTSVHSFDSVWVGVSAADDQSYVPDQLSPLENRSGNESAIVPVLCGARYCGRPTFDIPPTLDPVPVLLSPEPSNRPILFSLDLVPYLSDFGLVIYQPIQPERVSAESVFAAYRITEDNLLMGSVVDRRNNSETEAEVTIPNPTDRVKVLSALRGASTDTLEDRFVVFLAGSHPYRDRLFEPVTNTPIPLGPFLETLPPKASRYVYRIRKSDFAGHLSAGGAIAKVIVRVPSIAPGAIPELIETQSNDSQALIKLKIPPDPNLSHLLLFNEVASKDDVYPSEAKILRVPNAPELYPNHGIRLSLPGRSLLAPQSKSLHDADVSTDSKGFHTIVTTFSGSPGERIRVWACTITRDGIPSLLGGPWNLPISIAPLPLPNLILVGTPPNLTFIWSWPPSSGASYIVSLERSADGVTWIRVSAPIAESVTTYRHTQSNGRWEYRLQVMSPDGRTAYSNTVIQEMI